MVSYTNSDRRLPIGVEVTKNGLDVRIWAPRRKETAFVTADAREWKLTSEGNGYFSALIRECGAGVRYKYRLDGDDRLLPDPVSRFQPEGPDGWSQSIDAGRFQWTDGSWKGVDSSHTVLYELHVGTFTKEGTWAGAAEHLPYLKELGVTCIECMPVAEFPGTFNWGYDGVDLFAPTRNYGTPDDFRSFVNAAHMLGIGVILDVVYNHFGPAGNYIIEYASEFYSEKYSTDWGEAINFDGKGAEGVREFYISNARYWISEFHIDGYRFDATQNIYDDSPVHILSEIVIAAREEANGRKLYMIGENESQQTKMVRSVADSGIGLNALWNDDFHHLARVALAGKSEAYLSDYRGTPQEFVSALKWGFLSQGQLYTWQKKRRGTQTFDLDPHCFINFIQNHDQIANVSNGTRISALTSFSKLKAVTAILLLAPQTPLLFQGQEFCASAPFYYFGDHEEDLAKKMIEGRERELRQFPSLGALIDIGKVPHPQLRDTFTDSKLDHTEKELPQNAQLLKLHKDLLELRKCEPFLTSQDKRTMEGAVLSESVFVLRFFAIDGCDKLLVANLGQDFFPDVLSEPLFGTPTGKRWQIQVCTEDLKYGGNGFPAFEHIGDDPRMTSSFWAIPGSTTSVLELVDLTTEEMTKEKLLTENHEKSKKKFLTEL